MTEQQQSGKSETSLYQTPIKGAELTLEVLHRDYDGTVFNGMNAVKVVFNDQGEVERIDSTFTSTGEPSVPFTRGKTGGWRGEGGFYGESTVMGKKLDAIIEATKADWEIWKQTESEHQGVDFRTWKAQRADAMASEYRRLKGETS